MPFSLAKTLGLVFVIVGICLWWAGSVLTAPHNHPVGKPPAELAAQSVQFDGVHGWYVPTANSKGCVLLLHGVRDDRRSMVGRALFLKRHGYAALLIDMQAHGETLGDNITFGYREAGNAKAALAYLKQQRACNKVAVIGKSMGGAASLLGNAPLQADALVLESVYPSIEAATANRLAVRLGRIGPSLAPLLYAQIPLRLDVPLEALHPHNAISKVHCPVLLISGSDDRHTSAAETRMLFANAPSDKQLWLVAGAAHVDLYRFAGHAYEQTVMAFLDKHLRN